MFDARAITTALGGRWHDGYGAAPCPVCQPERRKGQNALTLADGNAGRLVLHCKKSACAFLDILAAAGLRSGDYRPPDPATLARREAERRAEAQRKAEHARRCWQEAQNIAGTPAEAYLRGRGLTCELPRTLRFHGACWHGPTARRWPALVATVQGAGARRRCIAHGCALTARARPTLTRQRQCSGQPLAALCGCLTGLRGWWWPRVSNRPVAAVRASGWPCGGMGGA